MTTRRKVFTDLSYHNSIPNIKPTKLPPMKIYPFYLLYTTSKAPLHSECIHLNAHCSNPRITTTHRQENIAIAQSSSTIHTHLIYTPIVKILLSPHFTQSLLVP